MADMNSRNKRPRDRKSQLAAVASELFRQRGYHGVGINDIAAAAGVTGPAIYRHFADKQAILAHVLLSGLRDMEIATEAALDPERSSTPERIRESALRSGGAFGGAPGHRRVVALGGPSSRRRVPAADPSTFHRDAVGVGDGAPT